LKFCRVLPISQNLENGTYIVSRAQLSTGSMEESERTDIGLIENNKTNTNDAVTRCAFRRHTTGLDVLSHQSSLQKSTETINTAPHSTFILALK
jgi:hypothetical protein